VDTRHASSGWATYTISSVYHDDPTREVRHQVEVDEEHVGLFQSPFGQVDTHAQWISLGTYYFSSQQPARVTLTNATGEHGQQIAADGIEFAPLNPPTPPVLPTPTATPTPTPETSEPAEPVNQGGPIVRPTPTPGVSGSLQQAEPSATPSVGAR
jgi:hypothetical protein